MAFVCCAEILLSPIDADKRWTVSEDLDRPWEFAEPSAAAMVESLRAIGYSLPAAVADLVDNSISANSKNIWIDCFWNGGRSHIMLTDDGTGMTETELLKAMTLGSINPLENRKGSDLGRFGLGLKTASFSQCRRLTVRSKSFNSEICTREWDLDQIAKVRSWRLFKTTDDEADLILQSRFSSLVHGTIVLLRSLDKVVHSNVDVGNLKDESHFLAQISDIEQHLSMTFHRFLERRGQVKIFLNERQIEPWDPFLIQHDFTQEQPEERINSSHGSVVVRGFVLPHQSKLSEEEKEKAEGPRGWIQQQGLYVYRNRRLLVAGGWPGLRLRSDAQFQLARISVDISNATDLEWELDIRKARAIPPISVRGRLRQIAEIVRDRSSQTIKSKGKIFRKSISKDFVPVWSEVWRGKTLEFQINRAHPVVNAIADSALKREFELLLRLLEETMPVEQIFSYLSESSHIRTEPFNKNMNKDAAAEVTKLLNHVIATSRISPAELEQRLLEIEPFNRFPELVSATLNKR